VSQQNRNPRAPQPSAPPTAVTPPAPPADPPAQPDPPVTDVEQASAVTTADVAALRGESAAKPEAESKRRRRITVSEGVAHDLRRLGKVTDPGTGLELRRDRETGVVSAHHRGTGEPADAEIRPPRID
jgi:hypothetical protein